MRRSPVLLVLTILVCAILHAQGGVHFTATSQNVSGAGETIKINLTSWSLDSQRDELVAAWNLTATAPQGRGGRGAAGGGAGRGGGNGGTAGRGARGGNAAAAAPDVPADPDAPDSPAPRGRGAGNAPAQTPEGSLAAALKKASSVGILWTSENVGYSIKYAYQSTQPDGGVRVILATDRRVGMWSSLWKPGVGEPTDYTFSIIELRLNSKGEGEGRGVMTGKVVVDTAAKTIALDQYASLPVILKGVKRQGGN